MGGTRLGIPTDHRMIEILFMSSSIMSVNRYKLHFTSSYDSLSAASSIFSPISFRPLGRNQYPLLLSYNTTTLPEDGWMMAIPAPSRKSLLKKRLSGTAGVELDEKTHDEEDEEKGDPILGICSEFVGCL